MTDQQRILVVDDKRAVHEHVRTLLSTRLLEMAAAAEDESSQLDSLEDTGAFLLTKGFRLDSAFQGLQGVSLVRKALAEDKPYAVAIVDMLMPPGLDGVDTVQRIWDIDPEIQVVLCAQHFKYSWSEIANRLTRPDSYLILRKPFEKHEILQVVYALAEKWQLRREVERANERRYRALYHDAPAMFLTLSRKGRIVSANDFGAKQLGYTASELVGVPWTTLHRKESRAGYREHLLSCLRNPDAVFHWQGPKLRKDGSVIWVRETSRTLPDESGELTVLSVCDDITRTRRLEKLLLHQSRHDPLTGLVNRHELEQRMGELLEQATGDHALVVLDLDQFRVINESCGHESGDELLREVTRLLLEQVRTEDVAARLGGDEFGVLLPNCTVEGAEAFAERVRDTLIAYRFVSAGQNFVVGASIGVVPFGTTDRVAAAALLEAAKGACDAAKDAGRNTVCVYPLDSAALVRRQSEGQWIAKVQHALENDQFVLFQQPIVPVVPDPDHGLHYEILVRWRDPDGKLVPPGAFMPATERSGLARELDAWVVRRTFAWLRANPVHTTRLGVCSVNLSGVSLSHQAFLSLVLQELEDAPAQKICFEITETAAVSNLTAASRFIAEVKRLGCTIALDDFGSGLSSFGYLKSLPVDFLKIDGSLVKHIHRDPGDLAMVKSIAEMGRALGKRTVAEFVENPEILQCLRRIGVDFAQGYGVGRPEALERLCDAASPLAKAG